MQRLPRDGRRFQGGFENSVATEVPCRQHAPKIDHALPSDLDSFTTEAKHADMDRVGREVPKVSQGGLGKLLVEEHPHGYCEPRPLSGFFTRTEP